MNWSYQKIKNISEDVLNEWMNGLKESLRSEFLYKVDNFLLVLNITRNKKWL